ncbi:hypothetical protein GCM10023196_097200 [Actinoallomurus vinaceus]|uniref:Glycosyltransferase 2-like domain-containing protein n=1 Tax=Actinoallomurus vinaceus TaxID=1080074 RepID=A0ABP8UVX7_9ACTN
MSPRILVGLPSFNEADAIAIVTRDVDEALATMPFQVSAVLVNADNSSTDGTVDAFMATPTRYPKHAIATPHSGGKGRNWRAVFELLRDKEFDVALMVDTDLGTVPASWIHALATAVVSRGSDFVFPLRPATWNGGDLTYHLAYPALAGAFGGDLREPLCGEIAISRSGAERVLDQDWTASDFRFGIDALVASVALATGSWRTVALREQRRNKLRSFTPQQGTDYRMGAKFAEVAATVRRRCRIRLYEPMPESFVPCTEAAPTGIGLPVPHDDPDITRLAEATTGRLIEGLDAGAIDALPQTIARPLSEHIASGGCRQGLPWPVWRDVLLSWIKHKDDETIPIELLETLFLNRVVGHHTEIRGTADWYDTVRQQTLDFFAHRASLWGG